MYGHGPQLADKGVEGKCEIIDNHFSNFLVTFHVVLACARWPEGMSCKSGLEDPSALRCIHHTYVQEDAGAA